MLALTRAVFGTWTKNTSLAKVYIFPTTLWMKSLCRVSRFHPRLFSEHLHSFFPHTHRSGPSSLARALWGTITASPMTWSLWSLSKKKLFPPGDLFFMLSGFLLPLSWKHYLQSRHSYRTKFSRCLCCKFRILCLCVTPWNSSCSPEAMLLLLLLNYRLIMIF